MHKNILRSQQEATGSSCFGTLRLEIGSVAITTWRYLGSVIGSFLVAMARFFRKIVAMIQSKGSDDLLSYVPKRDKIVEGGLLLLERAAEAGQSLTAAKLVTTMFLADKGHLDAYGRPVFFDNYVAAKNGPEGAAAREMLDPNYDWAAIGTEIAPWDCETMDGLMYPRPLRPANLRRLSETDVEALESALAMVMNLDPNQLSLFTHRGEAYVAAWDSGRGAGSRLDPRLVPDTRDDEMIDELLYASRHAFIAPHR